MKKVFSFVIGLCLSVGAFAQVFGPDVDLDFELGESPFTLAPVSYFYFGFNGITGAPAKLSSQMSFSRSQQMGINLVELAVNPFEGGRFSLGLDFSANWYRLGKEYMWYPYYMFNNQPIPSENGLFVDYTLAGDLGITEVKSSYLSVYSFGVPLTFSYSFGKITLALGGTVEVNFDGLTGFKGVAYGGEAVDYRRSGLYYSKKIGVNRVTFNVHAAVSYGGLGFFAKFSPVSKFYKGLIDEKEVVCGPQFQTWTVGLILGLGM